MRLSLGDLARLEEGDAKVVARGVALLVIVDRLAQVVERGICGARLSQKSRTLGVERREIAVGAAILIGGGNGVKRREVTKQEAAQQQQKSCSLTSGWLAILDSQYCAPL